MTKVYITFGQIHAHATNGGTVDKDTIGIINCTDYEDGHAKAMEWFEGKFHNCYSQEEFANQIKQHDIMQYFPKGYIEVNPQ